MKVTHLILDLVVYVNCGLMSRLAIFPLYTIYMYKWRNIVIKTQNFDLVMGTHVMGNCFNFKCWAYPNTGIGAERCL